MRSPGALLRDAAMLLLRRRSCCGPLLLLLGAALCLFYQNLTVSPGPQRPASGRGKPAEEALLEETRRLITSLETAQVQIWSRPPPRRRRALVLTGRHLVSDTEVQIYQQVLQHMGFQVQLSRYAETTSVLGPNHGVSGWSLLLCLSSSERSCLRRISFSHLQRHQMVNLLPELMEAFSDAGGGLCHLLTRSHATGSDLSMRPRACGSANQKLALPQVSAGRKSAVGAPPPALVAMVNVYVLVTSANPLIAFLHDISVVTTNQEQRGQATKLSSFPLQQLGPATSHNALGQVKKVIGDVLQAAVSTNQKLPAVNRCVLCYQLLTFTLLLSGSASPVVVQVDRDLTFSSLAEDSFDGRISRDLILDDSLHFLLSWGTRGTRGSRGSRGSWGTRGSRGSWGTRGTRGTRSSAGPAPVSSSSGVCLSEDDFLLLLQFQQQLKTPSSFKLLYPSSSCSSGSSSSSSSSCSSGSSSSSCSSSGLSDLLVRVSCFYELQTNISLRLAPPLSQDVTEGVCVDPHLRQIYMDPPLILTPPFSPEVKEYHAEVNFDTAMVRIRPEPVSSACRVHLDEHRGPRMANYPIGLGSSRISILVTDDAAPQPVVMTIYTVYMYRESRPSLPMFGDHVTCSFRQDCGLVVQPGLSCGLQPFIRSQTSDPHTCSSGHEPGQWVVPCLSCSDNRTCDWREVAWQPDGCYHPVVGRPLLQQCMQGRKVLFIGDSTNRGMMYFLMERVNSSLEDWGKAHDTLVYRDLNGGRTLVSYSYYPQFWLDKIRRPTFRQALLQLIHRSRPLANSNLTALVVGGVQWLNTDHLRTIREVLIRESLSDVQVLVKSLGMGFHLPVDGIRSLSLNEIQQLHKENHNIIAAAKHHGYDVIDTFSITMGRYKEFLQGRCACHFHEVEKVWTSGTNRTRSGFTSQSAVLDMEQEAWPKASSYHVRGPVNQVYSEILLSRLCPRTRG